MAAVLATEHDHTEPVESETPPSLARGTAQSSPLRRRTPEELEAALAARDEFIALLGHELRNAIAPLVLLTEQFAPTGGIIERRMRPRPELLLRHLRKLTATIERVAEVSQLRDGRLAVELERVELDPVIKSVSEALEVEAGTGGIELRLRLPSGVVVWADRTRVKQILIALIRNAIKHSGGSNVYVAARLLEGRAELIVEDDGGGIPESLRLHMFDRFDHKGPRQRDGLGVGLWVVNTLCRAMGGEVTLEDAVGPGARFCVRLPVADSR